MIVSIKKLKRTNWIDEEPCADEQEPVGLDFAGSSFEASGLAFPCPQRNRPSANDAKNDATQAMGHPMANTTPAMVPEPMPGNTPTGLNGYESLEADGCSEQEAVQQPPSGNEPLRLLQPGAGSKTRLGWVALSVAGHLVVVVFFYIVFATVFQSSFLETLLLKSHMPSPASSSASATGPAPVKSHVPSEFGAQAGGTVNARVSQETNTGETENTGNRHDKAHKRKKMAAGDQEGHKEVKENTGSYRTEQEKYILPSGQIVHMLDLSEIPLHESEQATDSASEVK